MLQPSDAVITQYCLPSDFTVTSIAYLQLKILVAIMHFINRNIIYILKVERSISKIVRICFNFIIGRASLARENEVGDSWGQEVHILHVNI